MALAALLAAAVILLWPQDPHAPLASAPAPAHGKAGGPSDAPPGGPAAEQGGVSVSRFDTRKMDALLMIVVFSMDVVLRTGSCEVRE